MNKIDVSVSTSSSTIPWPWPAAPYAVPSITVNGESVVPANPTNSPTGIQQVIYDINELAKGSTRPLYNDYMQLFGSGSGDGWGGFDNMWDYVLDNYLKTGNPDSYLMILATYGIDHNMGPNSAALQMLLRLGAGPAVQQWLKTSDRGSQMGNNNYWTATPGNYILIGVGGRPYGQAPGEIQQIGEFGQSKTTTLTATVPF